MLTTPRNLTVLVDRREKRPLFFPETITWYPKRGAKPVLIRVTTQSETLEAGDYCLKGWDDVCIIERKGSASELCQNFLSKDYTRAQAAFQKLIEACEYPYVLLEAPMASFLKPPSTEDANYRGGFQAFLQYVASTNLRVLYADNFKTHARRRVLGEVSLLLMLSHVVAQKIGPIDISTIVEEVMKCPKAN